MATLSKEHRKLLENTVAAARKIAVAGAEKALIALRVGDKESPSDAGHKELRSQLRAHGRQLGDRRQPSGTQETVRLEQAFAYEHWHRLLFARFLAENDLLVNPEFGVPMSLAEVQETAREQNCDWLTLASGYAQQMLLGVFRPDDPVLRVALPPETRQQLEEKLTSLPVEIFRADDSLGWVYQFWQRDEKDKVNASGDKIGADQLPAVTQLFTEDYMVLFLLENTIGAWWTAKRQAEGKDYALPGYEWTYLRLKEDGSPTAGAFDGWPRLVRDLRVLDPSAGSGHFLTFALPILARMRVEEEGLPLRDAVYSVLQDNLSGLELDPRCSQIAAFNLALAAWRVAGEHFALPELNLACSGLGIHASEDDWVLLGEGEPRAEEAMRQLYKWFGDAPTLGSLIDPHRVGGNLLVANLQQVRPILEEALGHEAANHEEQELLIAARGVLSSFRILASEFTLVATNVPYLGRNKQDDKLKDFCDRFHGDSKSDLATAFMDRVSRLCKKGGTVAIVSKQEPLYLRDFITLRRDLLRGFRWDMIARLGEHAFDSAAAAGAFVALWILSNSTPSDEHAFAGLLAADQPSPAEKARALQTLQPLMTHQLAQLKNPDYIVILGESIGERFLSAFANAWQGIATSDFPRFGRHFWEIPKLLPGWVYQQTAPTESGKFSGRDSILYWEDGNGAITEVCQKGATFRGKSAWGKPGVVIGQMRSLPVSLYSGEHFSNTVAILVPFEDDKLPALWAFCSSEEFQKVLRRINPKVNVDNGYISKVPFDFQHWQREASERYPKGLPAPTSSDPTQWLFNGHPMDSDNPLHVAMARLVGYRWPRQTGSAFLGAPQSDPDGLEQYADADGIVALKAIAGEASAVDRLRSVLAHAYGEEWSAERLKHLLGEWTSLEEWLRDGFFDEHCQMFQQRPFVWHIWDGTRDGFHAFVNYHKLCGPNGEGRKTLEKLIYSTLGDWIHRQEAEVESGTDGAEVRVAAARHLKAELLNILNGERPYDLFVRWRPLRQQAIGWEPHVDDGVRLNMRPWLYAKPYVQFGQKEKHGASILRVTPIRLDLGKDRGNEPLREKDEFPWYATSQDRTNDLHFTLEEKRAARERKKKA